MKGVVVDNLDSGLRYATFDIYMTDRTVYVRDLTNDETVQHYKPKASPAKASKKKGKGHGSNPMESGDEG